MQQHYLPKETYLKFFEIPDRPGLIYFYQRGRDILAVSIHNVAKEKDLYSFTDKDGKLNAQVEIGLGEIEGNMKPLLTQLNEARETIEITLDQRNLLMTFVSLQAARTPAFRSMLKQAAARFSQIVMQAYAASKETFLNLVEGAQRAGFIKDLSGVTVDELREFVLDETRYTVEAGGDHFLVQQFELQDSIFRAITLKKTFLLRCEEEAFATSDHPVLLLGNPEVPKLYRGGFLLSDVLLPIGSHVCLVLRTEKTPEAITGRDQVFPIVVKKISSADVRQINKMTLNHAENYLFSSEKNEKVKALFDQTTRPIRFQMHSPFTRDADKRGSK